MDPKFDCTTRWTHPPAHVIAGTQKQYQNAVGYGKRLRAAFAKGAALSKEELECALVGEVDTYLYRKIRDQIREISLLIDISENTIGELVWLSERASLPPDIKASITQAIYARSRRQKHPSRSRPISMAPSAQNDKAADFGAKDWCP